MTLKTANSNIKDINYGKINILKVMKGADLVWEKFPPKEITFLMDRDTNPNDDVIYVPSNVTRELTGKEIISIEFDKIAKIDGKRVAQLNTYTIKFDSFLYSINHNFKDYILSGTKVIILYKEKQR